MKNYRMSQDERDLSHLSFGADPLPEIAHIGLGFEGKSDVQNVNRY